MVAACLLWPAAAEAQEAAPNAVDPTPATCDENTISFHVGAAKGVIRHAFDHDRWRLKHPYKRSHKRRVNQHRDCLLEGQDRKLVNQYRRKRARSFRRYRKARLSGTSSCAPDELVHPEGSGCWVIPTSVVMCESGGNFGALNPTSSAGGAYQALPSTWRAFGGTGSPHTAAPLEQHQVAYRILQGQGSSAWSCWG